VHGPRLPSQGDRGSCTAVTVATDHQALEHSRRRRCTTPCPQSHGKGRADCPSGDQAPLHARQGHAASRCSHDLEVYRSSAWSFALLLSQQGAARRLPGRAIGRRCLHGRRRCCVRDSVSGGAGCTAALRPVPRDTRSGARPTASLARRPRSRAPQSVSRRRASRGHTGHMMWCAPAVPADSGTVLVRQRRLSIGPSVPCDQVRGRQRPCC